MSILRLFPVLILAAVTAAAQPPPESAPREPPHRQPDHEGPREGRRPLERWMNQMKMQHPEDYERLMELRESDPEAFAAELRTRRDQLRHRNLEAGMAEKPRLREMMADLSPEERERMAERFSKMIRSQPRRQGPGNEKIAAGERKAWELARAFREAPEDEKAAIRTELRTQIEEVFELRETQHQQQIDEAERHLKTLKEALEKRREHRQQIVDQRLKELTTGEHKSRKRPGG